MENQQLDQTPRPKAKKWFWIALIIILLVASLFVLQDLFLAPEEKQLIRPKLTKIDQIKFQPSTAANFDWSEGRCQGKKGTVKLTVSPMESADIGVIYPYGTIDSESGHVTPIDHQYYYPTDKSLPYDAYPVFAPADGDIISIGVRNQFVSETGGENPIPDYQIVFEHSCSFWSYFDLVTKLSPTIASQASQLSKDQVFDQVKVRIPVKAGQEIGRVGGRTLDFGVYDSQITLPGFLVLDHYNGEPWKPHTVDPYDFFVEPVRSELIAKTVRSAEPIGGKIDYDLDGKVQGNWFVVGSKGFSTNNEERNWRNHLSFFPDAFDPSFYIFSSGNIEGIAKSYGLKNPTPAPDQAGVSDGLIKYQLVDYNYVGDSGPWNKISYARNIKSIPGEKIQGVVLLQLVSQRKLKVEVFLGQTLNDVNQFTNKAILYER